MSDPTYRDPRADGEAGGAIDHDAAVARANEGLAEAEAAADASTRPPHDDEPDASLAEAPDAVDDPANRDDTDSAERSDGLSEADAALYEQAMAEAAFGDPDPDDATRAYAAPEDATRAYVASDAETRVYEPARVEPAPVVDAPTQVIPPVAASRQPVFVQAPDPPRPKGNRGAAGAIGLLAAIVFGILYLGVSLGLDFFTGDVTADAIVPEALSALTSWWLWVPVGVFFIAFWLLGAIVNRGRWGLWVHLGLLVGLLAYGGHIFGQLVQASFWTITVGEGMQIVGDQLLAPLAIAAFVIGREVTIWFGAWVAARGRRVSERNHEAQREYERTLEAGPRIQQG